MANKDIKANLAFIKANYENIPSCITRLETSEIFLAEKIGIVNNMKACIIVVMMLFLLKPALIKCLFKASSHFFF